MQVKLHTCSTSSNSSSCSQSSHHLSLCRANWSQCRLLSVGICVFFVFGESEQTRPITSITTTNLRPQQGYLRRPGSRFIPLRGRATGWLLATMGGAICLAGRSVAAPLATRGPRETTVGLGAATHRPRADVIDCGYYFRPFVCTVRLVRCGDWRARL